MKLQRRSASLVEIFLIILLSTNAYAKRVSRPEKLSSDEINALSQARLETTSTPFFAPSQGEIKPRDVLIAGQDKECRNVHQAKDKCAFVRKHCKEENIGFFNYLDLYYCWWGNSQWLALGLFGGWLSILFATIGTAASEYFTTNLQTISSVLGMSENLAGVTLLALGNGSPDVFSTIAAMKIDSGSLAVGELIGAACFITAVVSGAMACVKPFRVGRRAFLRDVTFFTGAIVFGLFFLADGQLTMWECVVMIVYYALYVAFVVGWHFFEEARRKKRRKERNVREHYTAPEEEDLLLPDEDDEEGAVSLGGGHSDFGSLHDFGALEAGAGKDDEDDEDAEDQERREFAELSNNLRSRPGMERRFTATPTHSIRPSLAGALEFRSVLRSLEKEKNLQGGHNIHLRRYSDDPFLHIHDQRHQTVDVPTTTDTRHTPQSLLRPSSGRIRAVSVNDANRVTPSNHSRFQSLQVPTVPDLLIPEADTTGSGSGFKQPLRLNTSNQFLAPPSSHGSPAHSPAHSPTLSIPVSPLSKALPRLIVSDNDSTNNSEPTSRPLSPPIIRLPDPSLDSLESLYSKAAWSTWRYWPYSILPPPEELYATLFPGLYSFWEQDYYQRLFSIAVVPSNFLLTITLPVVRDLKEDLPSALDASQTRSEYPGSPTSFLSATTAPTPMMPAVSADKKYQWKRWLVATQCITSPLFMVLVIFNDGPLLIPLLYALLSGFLCLALLLSITSPDLPPTKHYILCIAGFAVAITWISAIAGEVVALLKALGVIFAISDAILGLTIFAVGNSLGDLVANITIASAGFPVMGFSACFGGPLLNILMGIGIGGFWMTAVKGERVYRIEVGGTLIVSAVTLLATLLLLLVLVPWNRFWMRRGVGFALIALWVVSTLLNVLLEITGWGGKWGGRGGVSV
ncbi:Sodium/calcium exchanger protein-domain-containing protein [Pyronema omphalodes]|nr:Sodium/calcium exchanger protein-domain-containing protein [Pyronema omphalodes]